MSVESEDTLWSSNSLRILENLPKEFTKISKKNNLISFTTEEMSKLDRRIDDATYFINGLCQKLKFISFYSFELSFS